MYMMKCNMIQMQTKNHTIQVYSTPNLKRVADAQFSSQPGKSGLVQGLGENVCKLFGSVYIVQINVTLLIVISQKVVPHLYVFGLRVQNRVLGNTNGSSAITQQRDSRKVQTIVLKCGYHPKQLGAASSSSNILGFYSGLSYIGLLARGPRYKRSAQKLTCA